MMHIYGIVVRWTPRRQGKVGLLFSALQQVLIVAVDAGKEWVKKITAEYHDEFLVLPEDERRDPVARRRVLEDIIEEFRAAHFDRMDDQKERGGAPAVMQKILKYFVTQVIGLSLLNFSGSHSFSEQRSRSHARHPCFRCWPRSNDRHRSRLGWFRTLRRYEGEILSAIYAASQ